MFLVISIILNVFFLAYFIYQQIKNAHTKKEKTESDKIKIGSTGIIYEDFWVNSTSYSKCIVEFVVAGVSKTKVKIRILDITLIGFIITEEQKKKMVSSSDGSWVNIDKVELCEINNRDYKINQIIE